MEAVETRVAVIAIIVRDGTQVAALNDLLHQYGPYIVGRMGCTLPGEGREYHQRGPWMPPVTSSPPCLESWAAWRALPPRPSMPRQGAYERKKSHELEEKIVGAGPVSDPDPVPDCLRQKTSEPEQPEEPTQTEEPADKTQNGTEAATAHFRIAALKGPTAMGLVELMSLSDTANEMMEGKENVVSTGNTYEFTLAGSADEVTPALIKGDLDMACVPANLAAVLYGKTGGAVEVLAVNTLGVLYIVENGETVQSMADLKGQTIVAAGKGSTPEYALRYLLTENGIDPDKDVTIDWKSEHSECVAALASGQAAIALLPQPFVTVAQTKIEGLRMALDLTAEWDKLDNGSALITGVIVARRDVVEANPGAVDSFLQDYAASVEWVNANNADAAQLIAEYGIIEAAPVAEKALPYCNIVCITGSEMKDKLSGYLQVLADAEPSSVGGALPGDDFYYGA